MTTPLLLALAALSAPAFADNLTRIRIQAPDAPALAQRLLAEGYDVLEGSIRGASFEVVASDESLERFQRMGLTYTVLAVGRPFEQIQAERRNAERWKADGVPPGYLNLNEIYAQMNDRAGAFPDICQVVDLTATYNTPPTHQGRHIFAVKISDNVNIQEDEPSFLLVACHHAREINTPVVALDTIDRLLNGYGVDPDITALVDKYEIWVAPVWNPDGYNHVFTTNNLWRKNRRPNSNGSFGVDLNRNYPLGWNASCDGSTNPSSETYKGPSPASEPETQLMRAFGLERHFTKVLDYHSFGRETLFEYACLNHPFMNFLRQEAIAIATASGYGAGVRAPSAEGENQESHMAYQGSHAFLTEIGNDFQPPYASAVAEANMVWGGTRWLLNRPIPICGHVTDAVTGQPVVATITYTGVTFTNGETNSSGGPFGRYHAFLPNGTYTLNFTAPGYQPAQRIITVVSNTETVVDVALQPLNACYANCDNSTIAPVLNVNDFLCFQSRFAAGDSYANCDNSTIAPVLNVNDFLCFQSRFAAGCQ